MSTLSLETTAYREIWNRIVRADYMPGRMLSENELAGELGMSRTPIRAAISQLEDEGLVESYKGRGVLVKEISFHDFSEMLEVLVSLQLFALDTAAKRKLKFDLDTLGECLGRQLEASRNGDTLGYYDNSLTFIETILRTIRNENMIRIVERFRGKFTFKMVSYRKQFPQFKPQKSIGTNERVFGALQEGDIERAKTVLLEHYSDTYEQLVMNGVI
ncbi:GntR family transcriptional regulator [Cohnella nanjingensis]|uniref:GntR family transcriptional regulator n=1 Tax=Cohnella nanjingensis TaxID=1387779 RepID=A0A7X0RSN1_9BACL|nr:GntR family transcriptional regulator [Cohnella nanjingensis]MBB6671670.1 GntR family transcriptional regulator [Cohnella nanjingensis]